MHLAHGTVRFTWVPPLIASVALLQAITFGKTVVGCVCCAHLCATQLLHPCTGISQPGPICDCMGPGAHWLHAFGPCRRQKCGSVYPFAVVAVVNCRLYIHETLHFFFRSMACTPILPLTIIVPLFDRHHSDNARHSQRHQPLFRATGISFAGSFSTERTRRHPRPLCTKCVLGSYLHCMSPFNSQTVPKPATSRPSRP